MQPNEQIAQIALEARRAYRFLYQYQQRILDLMDFIGHSLGLIYVGGYSKFSNAGPRSGGGRLENWAWDWLNMYFYEFHFNDPGDVHFSVFHVADTGYYDSEAVANPAKRVNVATFVPVERSSTRLILVAGHGLWDSKPWGMWQSQEFLNGGLELRRDGGVMVSSVCSLDQFATQDAALETLRAFCERCQAYDIPVSVKERI